jgi:hypothetical protein
MFHPKGHPLERGWVGRIDGDRVIHLAAQTLQSFFTGGGSAREHAVYAREDVRLLAPVLHPPAVRIFDDQRSFAFANPAAVVGPRAEIRARRPPSAKRSRGLLALAPRLAAVIGAEGAIAGFTALGEWRSPALPTPKDRDFALGLGPLVATPEELAPCLDAVVRVGGAECMRGRFESFDWAAARDYAEDGTSLRPGDLLAGPALGEVEGLGSGDVAELEVDGLGVLEATVLGD